MRPCAPAPLARQGRGAGDGIRPQDALEVMHPFFEPRQPVQRPFTRLLGRGGRHFPRGARKRLRASAARGAAPVCRSRPSGHHPRPRRGPAVLAWQRPAAGPPRSLLADSDDVDSFEVAASRRRTPHDRRRMCRCLAGSSAVAASRRRTPRGRGQRLAWPPRSSGVAASRRRTSPPLPPPKPFRSGSSRPPRLWDQNRIAWREVRPAEWPLGATHDCATLERPAYSGRQVPDTKSANAHPRHLICPAALPGAQ